MKISGISEEIIKESHSVATAQVRSVEFKLFFLSLNIIRFKGAFALSFHVMNAESTKYFQRVIPMSGSAFNYNAYHDGDHRCLMFAIAKNASYPVDSTQDLIEFLKKIPADQIEQYIQSVFSFLPVPSFWAPVIESI